MQQSMLQMLGSIIEQIGLSLSNAEELIFVHYLPDHWPCERTTLVVSLW